MKKRAFFLLLTQMWSNTVGMSRVKEKKLHGLKRNKNDQTFIKLNHYLKPFFFPQKVKRKKGWYIWINNSCITLTLGRKIINAMIPGFKEGNLLLYYKWDHFFSYD